MFCNKLCSSHFRLLLVWSCVHHRDRSQQSSLDGVIQGAEDYALVCLSTIVSVHGSPHPWQTERCCRLSLPIHVPFSSPGLCRGGGGGRAARNAYPSHNDQQEDDIDTVTKVLCACHNARVGHFGGRRTYNLANKHF